METIPGEEDESAAPEESKSKPPKGKPAENKKRLISLGEFAGSTDRIDITDTLQGGFRVWMKTAKNEPLRSRTSGDWDKLFDEYLKS